MELIEELANQTEDGLEQHQHASVSESLDPRRMIY